jgi:uncharacterized membrane protein YkvA (DUF1232 family)
MHNKDNFSESRIYDEIETDSLKISSAELDEILSNESQIDKKVSKLNVERFSKFVRQLTLAIQMLKDYRSKSYSSIPWRTMALIVAAILYFINPFDIIPDFLPILGYTDDVVAFATIFKSVQQDLQNYCEWKGYNTEEYF